MRIFDFLDFCFWLLSPSAPVSRDSVDCIYGFLGILGILSENFILYGVPISVCGEGEVVVIVPERRQGGQQPETIPFIILAALDIGNQL